MASSSSKILSNILSGILGFTAGKILTDRWIEREDDEAVRRASDLEIEIYSLDKFTAILKYHDSMAIWDTGKLFVYRSELVDDLTYICGPDVVVVFDTASNLYYPARINTSEAVDFYLRQLPLVVKTRVIIEPEVDIFPYTRKDPTLFDVINTLLRNGLIAK